MLPPDPMLDERFEELVFELRDARVETPAALLERVDAVLARPTPSAPRHRRALRPRPSSWPRLSVRRMALGLGAVGGTGLVVAALATLGGAPFSGPGAYSSLPAGAAHEASTPSSTIRTPLAVTVPRAATSGGVSGAPQRAAAGGESAMALSGDVPAPLPLRVNQTDRLQHENAVLAVALPSVRAVSDATGVVTRAVQEFGGYVVTVGFDAATTGTGSVVAKVPIEKMQAAIARFSTLGTVTAEHVDLTDLQGQYDSLEQRIAAVGLRIARLQGQIATPGISQGDLYVARANLAQARLDLANLNHSARSTTTQAAMADLSVTLRTAAAVRKDVVPPARPSGIARSTRDALAILAGAGTVAVYLLIVASPLLVIGAIAAVTRRRLRIHRERVLLENA